MITEAAAANMGVVAPLDGFNAALVEIAHEAGALVILDEVLTGFRVSPAGWWGHDVSRGPAYTPDIFAFGKVIGGGMPLAALGGRAEVMNRLAPLGPVYQAGTLSGNPVAVAAGLATLRLADAEVYAAVDAAAARLSASVSAALDDAGVAHSVQRAGSLFSFVFGPGPRPSTTRRSRAQESWRYAPFFHAMLDGGVSLPPSVFEAWFLSAAHSDDVLTRIEDVLPAAARAAAEAQPPA